MQHNYKHVFSLYNNLKTPINLPKKITVKETKSATMNIFDFFYFLFKSFVKVELSYVFKINLFTIAENCMEKLIILQNRCDFLLLVIICVPPIIIDSSF